MGAGAARPAKAPEGSGHAPSSSMGALDGMRVLSNCGVLLAHSTFALSLPPFHYRMHAVMQRFPLVALGVNISLPSMDTFITLTSLLAVYHLVPALSSKPSTASSTLKATTTPTAPSLWQVSLDYYRRRLLRLVPPLYATMLLTWLFTKAGEAAGDARISSLLALSPDAATPLTGTTAAVLSTLALVQNFYLGGFVPFTWSVATQMQFCLVLPPLLAALRPRTVGFRGRVALLAVTMIAANIVWRMRCFEALNIKAPLVISRHPEDPDTVHTTDFLHFFYMSPFARLGNFGFGMLLGLLALSPRAMALARRPWAATVASVLALLSLLLTAAVTLRPLDVDPDPPVRPSRAETGFGFVWVMGLIFPVAIAVLIGNVLTGCTAVARTAARVLAHPVWKLPARLSYNACLLHAIAIVIVWRGVAVACGSTPQQLFFGAPAPQGSNPWSLELQDEQYNLKSLGHYLALQLGLWLAVQGLSTVLAVALEWALARALPQTRRARAATRVKLE